MVYRPRFTVQEKQQRMAAKAVGSVWETKSGVRSTVADIFRDEIGIERVRWAETDSCPVWHTVWGHREYTPVSVSGVSIVHVECAGESGEFEIFEDDAPDTLDKALKIVREALRGEEASRTRLQTAKEFRDEARKLFPSSLHGADLQAARDLLAEANAEYQEAEELHLMALSERRKIEVTLQAVA